MLTFLPGPVVGIIAALLYTLNAILIPLLLLVLVPIKYLVPSQRWRNKFTHLFHNVLPKWWVNINNLIMWLTTKTEWVVIGEEQLTSKGWYLLICNHQSWLDILLLYKVFYKDLNIPTLKFFMKQELLWALPVGGLAAKALGFPFMKRYSREFLAKRPDLRGKDLETTKKACKQFKNEPTTLITFIEGTRLTPEKYQQQASPYRHLLKPRAGGFAFALLAMEGYLSNIINATIIFPDKDASFWQFMCGNVNKIIITYEILPISKKLIGNYDGDVNYRHSIQDWLNQRWHEKDQQIEELLKMELK